MREYEREGGVVIGDESGGEWVVRGLLINVLE